MTVDLLFTATARLLLFGAALWLTLRLCRVRNPHVEALAWRMTLLLGLALPLLLMSQLAPSFTTSLDLPVIRASGEDLSHGAGSAAAEPSRLPAILLAIYLAGALSLLVRLVAGLEALRRIRRSAPRLEAPDDVRLSERIRSPATFGSTILLPADAADWPAERLDPVLAHERSHVRARDGYWSWLAQLHAAIFWFNPFAWWLKRRLEALAEDTSDDAVIAARHDRIAYAELLLDFARSPNHRSVAMSVADSNVPERIERLLAGTPPARALPRAARWSALALLVPAVILAASSTRAERPVPPAVPQAQIPDANFRGVKIVQPANPDNFYPAVAAAENVTGMVTVEVDVDVLGQLVDARVIKAVPADQRYGFGDAALEVARNTRYVNTSGEPASHKFKVKFAL